jgi:cysteine desulfurase NifS
MIYFDNAATTMLDPKVLETMMPYLKTSFGNPSSIYKLAQESHIALENARSKIAKILNARPDEIYFTSGGTESDNWAIKCIAQAYKNKGKHIITSSIEHHAVLHSCKYLESQGFRVTYLPVDKDGLIDLDELEKNICEDTILISIIFANNEIGTIQPIEQIGKIARNHNIVFHTDAVQAAGSIPIDVKKMNIDSLSISAHKFYGPKGVGLLYLCKGVKIIPFMDGGAQELQKRAGTENVASIVGMANALEIANENMEQNIEKITLLRDKIIDNILKTIPHCRLNGHRTKRLPNNINISFEFIEGESLLLLLDSKNIYASSGSACTSGSLDPSHVLLAIGLPHEIAHGSLRITLSKYNTQEEVDIFLSYLPGIIKRLRDMSPLYEEFLQKQTR